MSSSASSSGIIMFFAAIALSLAITYWASKRSKTQSELYAAGGNISAWQNGFAIAGDSLSAATFLGGIGMFYMSGFDMSVYLISGLIGFIIMLALIVGPLRKLGRYTFADVTAARLSPVPIRCFAAISALAVVLIYLTAQMIGAGALIELLFGIPYSTAVIVVGALMTCYVSFGGMLATTWVQIIKAALMLFALVLLSILALATVDFGVDSLYAKAAEAHRLGAQLFQPGGMTMTPLAQASVMMAFGLGIPGMPHILMRFFTVSDPVVARRSMLINMVVVAAIYTLLFAVVCPAAVAYVTGNADYIAANGAPRGGTNMVAIHLANFLGGDLFMGFLAAVSFATILAVVAGLNAAAASSISHDIYANVIARGKTVGRRDTTVFRFASLCIGIFSIVLGIAFEGQNIFYLTGMLFGIAASACFPVLVMSIYWRRLTTIGAIVGGSVGLVLSVGIIVMGPSIWVQILGHSAPVISLDQPAIISAPAAFIVMIVVSLLTKEKTNGAASRA